jgi:hypothetical protein
MKNSVAYLDQKWIENFIIQDSFNSLQLNFQELWTYLKIHLHFDAEIFFITLFHKENNTMFNL